MRLLVINGVNMNMLGIREPEKYGNLSLGEMEDILKNFAKELNIELDCWHSNIEGEIVEKIQQAFQNADGIVLNAAAYTHTSVAIRDAIASVNIPTIEVHMTNIHSREDFRQKSLIAGVCKGQISGFGVDSYKLAMQALCTMLKKQS